ncbi:S1 family peptidase [Micromonospora sp. CPCC 206061]|uniref:S1 family peptidase n=1 Tax=Micromonospora sp. CPCC 206061 TaxID=3122410 RepID=UPI002FF14B23
METTRSWRRVAVATVAAGVVATALTVPSTPAGAQPAGISAAAADSLVEKLGVGRTAGTWLDTKSGRMVVAVTDTDAQKAVVSAGGVAKLVAHSDADLATIKAQVRATVDFAGVAWGVEAESNRVTIEADNTVTAANYERLTAIARQHGDAVQVQRVNAQLKPFIQGGRFITPNKGSVYGSCSVGFNVRKKNNPNSLYILTAGHCTKMAVGVRDWFDKNGEYVGYDAGGDYPGNDFGLIKHNNAGLSKPGNVWLDSGDAVRDIVYSRDSRVNETVCSSGWRTGYRCGKVLSKNWEAKYYDWDQDGNLDYVWELDRTDLCTLGGDSGGSVFHQDAALGLVSGGPENQCITYVQPVNEALAHYGVEVY